MHDSVSHLIYLDNFSEEKNQQNLSGKRNSLSPQFASYFPCLPGSPGRDRAEPPPPPREPGSGEGRVCSSSGAQAPPRDVKLINFIMVVSSLMFFFAMSRL